MACPFITRHLFIYFFLFSLCHVLLSPWLQELSIPAAGAKRFAFADGPLETAPFDPSDSIEDGRVVNFKNKFWRFFSFPRYYFLLTSMIKIFFSSFDLAKSLFTKTNNKKNGMYTNANIIKNHFLIIRKRSIFLIIRYIIPHNYHSKLVSFF